MKKRTISLILMLAIFVCIFAFAACDKLGGESIDGTYYLYKDDGTLDKSDYVILKGDTWTSNDESSGTFKITDGKIELYIDFFGSKEVLFDGTISGGVMKLRILDKEYYYCKEGKKPSDAKTDNSSSSGTQNNKPATTAKKYDVTYNANKGAFSSGSDTFVQKVDENSLLTAPASPTRQGYSFTGWSKTKNGSDMWQFAENKVTENTTLYAQWTEKTAVILSVDGASIEDNSVLMVVNHTVDYVSLATKVVCSSDSTWRLYYDRLGLTEIPTKIAAQKTTGALSNGDNVFYMVVTSRDGTQINTYELTIHRSYLVNINYVGVYGTTVETKSTYSGYEYSANYMPSFTGYTFNYWKDDKGKRVTAFIPFASTTLYADYTAKTYTATLNVNGGNALSKTEYTVTYDSAYSYAKPSRTGYTFTGWYIGSTQITNANGSSISAWKYASNQTVTAHWQANEYTVTLNRNNSSAGTVSGDGKHNYDSNVTISASTNSGYTWVGWYDSNDTLVTTNTSYTFKMGLGATYTAKWTYYTVTATRNDTSAGTVTNYANTKVTAGKSVTVTATTNAGYTFVGWYNGATELTKNLSYTFTMPKDNVTYTAKWEEKEFDMSLFIYTTEGNTCTITGIKDKALTSIVVPSTIDGYSVTGIAAGAFSGCSNLESIMLPFVGGSASATSASSSTLFGYIFGTSSYTGGTETKQYYANNSSNYTTYYIPTSLRSVTITGEKNIYYGAFYNCRTLTSIEIPSSVTSIGSSAFRYCNSLTSIEIPSSVTSIGSEAFQYCSSLTSIEIPSSVTSIGTRAFQYCTSLTIYCEVSSKPSGWYSWWNDSNCPVVWNYGGERGETEDGIKWALTKSNTITIYGCRRTSTEVVIPSTINGHSVTAISNTAFCDCRSLTSIEIPSSVISIGEYAFYYCYSLTSIEIPSSVTSIGEYTFYNCSSLTSIEIPSSVTSIGSEAFQYCSSLTSIEIPSSVTSIGDYTFSNCSSLTIYCEVSSKPSGWSSRWNSSNRPVVWNYKG